MSILTPSPPSPPRMRPAAPTVPAPRKRLADRLPGRSSTPTAGRPTPRRPAGTSRWGSRRPAPRRTRNGSGIAFAVLILTLLGSALVVVLMLNTVIAQDAFVRTDLVKQQRVLHDKEQELRQAVSREEAPQQLAARAAALGMVPSQGPAFLRLRDHRILGVSEPAKAAAVPVPKPAGAARPAGALVLSSPKTPKTPKTTKAAAPKVSDDSADIVTIHLP